MPDSRNKVWIVVFTVFFPLVYLPVGFVVFFGINRFLALHVFASQPLPFWLFAVAGLVLGGAAVANNLRRTWPALLRLFRRSTNEGTT